MPALAVLATEGSSEERAMRPLDELLDSSAMSYPIIRCAGLYFAVRTWAGEDQLGPKMWEENQVLIEALLQFGALVLNQTGVGGSLEESMEIAVRDTNNVVDLYLARFETNFALEGQAFGSDPVIERDLNTCGMIADVVLSVGEGG